MDGIAGVQARINDIISQFQGPPVSSDATSAASTTGSATSNGTLNGLYSNILADMILSQG